MPIYEYWCPTCAERIEILVRGSRKPPCPTCESEDLERLLSLPRVHSEGTHRLAMSAARKRDRKQGEERVRAQEEYTRNHDD